MTEGKRQYAYIQGEHPASEPMCVNCVYYEPHFIRNAQGRYTEIFCGHCTAGYTKHREPWNTCKRFEMKAT